MSCRRARPRFRSIAPIAVLGTIALGGGAQGGDHLFGHTKYKVVQGYVVQPQAANNVVVVHAVAPAAATGGTVPSLKLASPQNTEAPAVPAKQPSLQLAPPEPQTVTLQLAPQQPQPQTVTLQLAPQPTQTMTLNVAPVQTQVLTLQAAPVVQTQVLTLQAAPVVQTQVLTLQAAPSVSPTMTVAPAQFLIPKHSLFGFGH